MLGSLTLQWWWGVTQVHGPPPGGSGALWDSSWRAAKAA